MKAQTAVKKTAEKAVGTSKGGKNTKIHTLVDGLGNPLAFLLSSGNDHDSVHAIPAATFLAIKLMERRKSEITFQNKTLHTRFHQKRIIPIRGL